MTASEGGQSGGCCGGHRPGSRRKDDGAQINHLRNDHCDEENRAGTPQCLADPFSPLRAQCSCSRRSVETMLQSFPQEDRDDMVENGRITVTCEFCNSTYIFQPDEITALNTTPS